MGGLARLAAARREPASPGGGILPPGLRRPLSRAAQAWQPAAAATHRDPGRKGSVPAAVARGCLSSRQFAACGVRPRIACPASRLENTRFWPQWSVLRPVAARQFADPRGASSCRPGTPRYMGRA